jgi:glyoxylase-like metal-dependent hydrolase (beta-lactamase superfamily II)
MKLTDRAVSSRGRAAGGAWTVGIAAPADAEYGCALSLREKTTSQRASERGAKPIRVLDLHFGTEGTIAAFLLQSREGPVLVETGPDSTFAALELALREAGTAPSEVHHALLTHIHLDHAGAAWQLARLGATVYVHPVGAPHLADPSKLLASARRIYGDQMDTLWGRLEPIPTERLRVVEDGEVLRIGELRVEALHTPGHATHHIAYRMNGTVFTGDVAGVRMAGGPVVPPCPPPDIDIEAWRASIARLQALEPETLYLTHFGPVSGAGNHLAELDRALSVFSAWVRGKLHEGVDEAAMVPLFEAYTEGFLTAQGSDETLRERYALANPAFMSVAGLARYWRRREGTAARAAKAGA